MTTTMQQPLPSYGAALAVPATPGTEDATPDAAQSGEREHPGVTHVGWIMPRPPGHSPAASAGDMAHGSANRMTPPLYQTFAELEDTFPPPRSINGIVTRGGDRYVRIEGQAAPERVHYDEKGKLRAEDGAGLAPAGQLSRDAAFRKVAPAEAPVAPQATAWSNDAYLLPGTDFSSAPVYRLGEADGAGIYHYRGRQFVSMDANEGVAYEVGKGGDGRLRFVMDDTGHATGPAVARKAASMDYESARSPKQARSLDAVQDDPSSFYLAEDDRAALAKHQSGEPVDPSVLARAQGSARAKSLALREAGYKAHPAVHSPLPPANIEPDATGRQIVDALYEGTRGLVVGESHSRPEARRFVHVNIEYLKEKGVDALFFEGPREVFPASLGMLRATGDKLHDDAVMQALDGLRGKWGRNDVDLLQKAIRHGMEVRLVDSRVAFGSDVGSQSRQSRLAAMNHLAQLEINKYQRETNGKWIALVGGAHAADDTSGGVTLPGIASMTGARDVVFNYDMTDVPKGDPYAIHVNKAVKHTNGSIARYQVVVDIPSEK